LRVFDRTQTHNNRGDLTINYGDSEPYSNEWLIVPPTVLKPQFDLLGEQWNGASKAISNADAMWFIGYSFPQSDSFMRYFLASALSNNAAINQLIVVDPDRKVEKRARSIFRAPNLKASFSFLENRWNRNGNQLLIHLLSTK